MSEHINNKAQETAFVKAEAAGLARICKAWTPPQPVTADTDEGALAVDIIKQWKTDPAIRAEFGTVARYAAYRQNYTLH